MGTLAVNGMKKTAAFARQYYGTGDCSQITVTAAMQQTIASEPFNIKGGEPQAGSAYELGFGGVGVWAGAPSSGQLIAFSLVLQGVTIANDINGVAAGAFSLGAGFRFWGRAEVVYAGGGTNTSVNCGMFVTLTESANAAGLFTAASNTVPLADSRITGGIDATSDAFLVVKCGWAGTVGAPTITNQHTIFTKVA